MRIDSRAALQCHEYLHKTNAPELFDLSLKIADDPLVEALKEAGGQHEEKVIKYLKQLPIKWHQVNKAQPDKEVELETLEVVRDPDIQMIFGASFTAHYEVAAIGREKTRKASRPDILFQTGKDSSGSPLWAPVDIKSHESIGENKSNSVFKIDLPGFNYQEGIKTLGRISEKDALQLAHYVLHLEELGLSDGSRFAGIIGKRFEFIAWADLANSMYGVGAKSESAISKYLRRSTAATKVIDSSKARAENPSLPPVVLARRISGDFGCPACEFRKVCRDQMESFPGNGHVTLLSEVTAQKADDNFPGIESIKDLSVASSLNDFGKKSALRASVWISGEPELLDKSEPFALPSFDVEIDIDLENSQAIFLDQEFEDVPVKDSVYLYGYGIHDRSINPDWNSAEFGFFDNYESTEAGELEVQLKMWNFLVDQFKKAEASGKSVGIFHYSPHEVTWWRKFANRFEGAEGVPSPDELNAFISKYFVDLLSYTRKIAFPLTGYSIKTLAPYAKFHWRMDDAGGGNSLLKYQTATSKSASESTKTEAIKWLREYNEDDVKATFAVRNFIRNLKTL